MMRGSSNQGRLLAALLALSLGCVAGCGDEESSAPASSEPPIPLPGLSLSHPAQRGPYAVGVTTVQTSDDGPLGRVLPVEVWYPAVPEPDAPIASYKFIIGVLELAELVSPGSAVRDAPADLRGAPHPVIVFSHGFGGIRFQSLYFTEYLASHGFVVAAPDHVGNTFAEMVATANALPAMQSAYVRPHDVSRTLDLLIEHSGAWPGLLYSMVDETRAGVAGHSFGGFTTLRVAGASVDVDLVVETCQNDPDETMCEGWEDTPLDPSVHDSRFRAALPQAPGGALIFEGGGLGDVAVPTMIQAGTLDQTTPFQEEAVEPFEQLPSPAHLIGIDRAGHFTFTDMCPVVEELGFEEQFEDGCSDANIPPAEAHAAINWYGTAFFQAELVGDASFASCLDPNARNLPGVTVHLAK